MKRTMWCLLEVINCGGDIRVQEPEREKGRERDNV